MGKHRRKELNSQAGGVGGVGHNHLEIQFCIFNIKCTIGIWNVCIKMHEIKGRIREERNL